MRIAPAKAAPGRASAPRPRGAGGPALLALLAALLGAAQVAAQPQVHVKGRARLELRLDRAEGPARLHGVLRDDLGEPLGARDVVGRGETQAGRRVLRRSVGTDVSGAFVLSLDLGARRYVVRAAFEGDDDHAPERVTAPLDLARADVQLRSRLPDAVNGKLDLDQPSHRVRVEAQSEAGAGGLAVVLVDERDRRLGAGVTAATGRVRLDVSSEAMAVPGAGRLRARTPGAAERAASQTELPVVRLRRPQLSLSAPARARAGVSFVVRGRLVDGTGPLRERAVGLYASRPPEAGDAAEAATHLGTVLTGPDGSFRFSPGLEGVGRHTLEARFASDGPGRPEARSTPATVEVAGAGDLRWAWSLGPLVLCLVAFVGLRRRPADGPSRAPSPKAPGGAAAVVPGRRRALRRRRIDGRVVGAGDQPLSALLQIDEADGGAGQSLRAGPDGRFRATLATGRYVLRVSAPDHATLQVPVDIPHRGAFTGITLRLQPVREAALDALAVAVVPSLGAAVFRRRTVHALASEPALSDATRALAREVEAAAYGPLAPSPDDVERLGDRARALRPESATDAPSAR